MAFGIVKEIFGEKSIKVQVPQEVTVDALMALLRQSYPAMNSLSSFAIAVNGVYARGDEYLSSAEEIAVIPPVSGG